MSDEKLVRVSDVMKIAHELALDGMGKLDVHALEGRLHYLPATDARPALLYNAMPVKPLELPPMIGTATDAREAALREAAAMFDEDSNIAQTILALIGEARNEHP